MDVGDHSSLGAHRVRGAVYLTGRTHTGFDTYWRGQHADERQADFPVVVLEAVSSLPVRLLQSTKTYGDLVQLITTKPPSLGTFLGTSSRRDLVDFMNRLSA